MRIGDPVKAIRVGVRLYKKYTGPMITRCSKKSFVMLVQNTSLVIESQPPDKDTRLEDIVADLPATVMSRPGSPDVWNFDEKEMSLKATPPRPTSASLCSPPVPRKVPISVDHHLRK